MGQQGCTRQTGPWHSLMKPPGPEWSHQQVMYIPLHGWVPQVYIRSFAMSYIILHHCVSNTLMYIQGTSVIVSFQCFTTFQIVMLCCVLLKHCCTFERTLKDHETHIYISRIYMHYYIIYRMRQQFSQHYKDSLMFLHYNKFKLARAGVQAGLLL